MIANLAEFHCEHEKFYSQAPLQDAVTLEARSRILKALAERAKGTSNRGAVSESLRRGNRPKAPGLTAESGVVFMEGEGEPAEIARLKRDRTWLDSGAYRRGVGVPIGSDDRWLGRSPSGSSMKDLAQESGPIGSRSMVSPKCMSSA